MIVLSIFLIRIIAKNGIKLQAAFQAELHSHDQQPSLTDTPEDQFVAFGLQFLQCFDGKGNFPPDGRILVFYYGSFEIYCIKYCSSINCYY